MRRFLAFTVERTLAGNADTLKEYVIGVEVFDKGASFDPRVDSIVRVEARRLRRKLREYYDGPGRADAIIIDFPSVGYVPEFRVGAVAPAVAVFAVLPFTSPADDRVAKHLGNRLAERLMVALAKYDGLRLVARRSVLHAAHAHRDLKDMGRALRADAILDGTVQRSGPNITICLELIDVESGLILWSESHERPTAEIKDLEDLLCSNVDAVIAPLLNAQTRNPGSVSPPAASRVWSLVRNRTAMPGQELETAVRNLAREVRELERAVSEAKAAAASSAEGVPALGQGDQAVRDAREERQRSFRELSRSKRDSPDPRG